MAFWDGFFASNDQHNAELARKIAERCCATTWAAVKPRALQMSPAEARGYIRARAGRTVIQEAESAIRYYGLSPAVRAEIIEQARSLLVETLLAEVQRSQARPALQRRAA